MNEEPINYPFISGTYEAIIESMAYNLITKGLVEHDKYEAIKAYCKDEVIRVHKKEREYSTGTTV